MLGLRRFELRFLTWWLAPRYGCPRWTFVLSLVRRVGCSLVRSSALVLVHGALPGPALAVLLVRESADRAVRFEVPFAVPRNLLLADVCSLLYRSVRISRSRACPFVVFSTRRSVDGLVPRPGLSPVGNALARSAYASFGSPSVVDYLVAGSWPPRFGLSCSRSVWPVRGSLLGSCTALLCVLSDAVPASGPGSARRFDRRLRRFSPGVPVLGSGALRALILGRVPCLSSPHVLGAIAVFWRSCFGPRGGSGSSCWPRRVSVRDAAVACHVRWRWNVFPWASVDCLSRP